MTEATELRPSLEFQAAYERLKALLKKKEQIKRSKGAESLEVSLGTPIDGETKIFLMHELRGEINGDPISLRVSYIVRSTGVNSYQPSASAKIFPGEFHHFNSIQGFLVNLTDNDQRAKAMHEQHVVSLVATFLE